MFHNRGLFRSKSFAKRLKNGLAKKKALHYSYTDDTAKYIVSSNWNQTSTESWAGENARAAWINNAVKPALDVANPS